MNKALLVGINNYPGNKLRGCVNDITDMAQFISDRCGFVESDVHVLTNKRATKKGIIGQFDWLLDGLRVGDRVLFFFSGHGVRIPIQNPQSGADTLHDAICPADFDWTEAHPEAHAITDTDFKRIFSPIPAGVEFLCVSDSCHSGRLIKGLVPSMPSGAIPKTITPPADIESRIQAAEKKAIEPMGFLKAAAALNVALIAACKSEQESADAPFSGRYNGVLTKFLLYELNTRDGLQEPLTKLVTDIRPMISGVGYTQVPQCGGSSTIRARAFLVVK